MPDDFKHNQKFVDQVLGKKLEEVSPEDIISNNLIIINDTLSAKNFGQKMLDNLISDIFFLKMSERVSMRKRGRGRRRRKRKGEKRQRLYKNGRKKIHMC